MKNTSALFIIDDVIANRLMELEDEHISHQVLHEESFHKHLIDIQEIPIAEKISDHMLDRRYLIIRSWQEIRELLHELQVEKNIYAWIKLFPLQLYTEDAYEKGYITESLRTAEHLLIRAVQEQKYVMFYC